MKPMLEMGTMKDCGGWGWTRVLNSMSSTPLSKEYRPRTPLWHVEQATILSEISNVVVFALSALGNRLWGNMVGSLGQKLARPTRQLNTLRGWAQSPVARTMSFDIGASSPFQIGGHRGCGENLWAIGLTESSPVIIPQHRENTIKSFQRAVKLGVSFVEFDVQVTQDGLPVLWHDDQVVMPSTACEVKDLSSQQFKQLVVPSGAGSTPLQRLFRSKAGAEKRLLPWVCQEEDSLPSLQEAMPPHIGFDVEVKMTQGPEVMTPPEEVTRVVQPIMACVDAATATVPRPVMWSSFDPDVCLALVQGQSRHPVMFLSGCGLYPHIDPRRTSIPAALDFARQHALAGVVVPASVVMSQPDLVAQARALSLAVMTYGLDNDQPDCVRQQKEWGVQAAICDDVASVLPALVGV
ncbi:GP-PDE domain-containing protein [Haematococcus lacustris]|uniref:glycerophosphodiester phosphodiesterase n=1 Tax=Haematococcus lacustris TaxID=44745 RepID=A0A699Z686_HAELA|nr:GP-PDE domain-containing protein [Haematococcus lacustris]